jgi:hypothetical protein
MNFYETHYDVSLQMLSGRFYRLIACLTIWQCALGKPFDCGALHSTLPVNQKDTLYQRLLGEEFTHLPPVLREFHSLPHGGQAQGVLQVQYGRGFVRRALAKLLRLPREGKHIAVHLQVQAHDNHEIWVRHFDDLRVQTTQWQTGKLLIEKAGPLCFAFRLSADKETLRFDFSHNQIGAIKLPFTVLQVDAQARGLEDSWQIIVMIRVPLIGLLVEYRGEIRPC